MWSALGKYKSIVVSIALFLLLDASVLTLNFYISFKIADDAVGVNLAGRQRMLSQRTVKSLLDLQSQEYGSEVFQKSLDELALSHGLFSTTLGAFDNGGSTKGAAGEQVQLKAVKSEQGRAAIEKANGIWRPYAAAIQKVINSSSEPELRQHLESAITYARQSNLELLALMNTLTVDLENVATSQATTLRYIQTAGITLAIINFLIILFHFIGELKRNDKQLEMARRETTEILETVNEGLFLLDENLKVGNQHSAQLTDLFGGKKVADIFFSELIGDLVKPKDLETAERFVGLLFRPDVKSNLISDLNPLSEVEINIADDQGGYETKFLSFEFTRVMDGKNIENILVTVNDVTARVLLARQLAEEKEKNEQQLEMLTSILHTSPSTLKRFIQSAFDTFANINGILKDQTKNETALRRKLQDIFVEIHNFKGEASALELDAFADLAHQFESDIQLVKDQQSVTGNDFLRLAVQLEKLIRYSESVQGLAGKLASFASIDEKSAKAPANKDELIQALSNDDSNQWQHLYSLCKNAAERSNKQAELVLTGFRETQLDEHTKTLVNDICIQLIRNAVVHSIESPEQRKQKGKTEVGRIDARLAIVPTGQLELSVRDDGAGLNYDKIRDKAIATGKWEQNLVAQMNNKQLSLLIFEPGFSTAEAVGDDAGRGVGMDVIKSRVLKHSGKLRLSSRKGHACQFTVTLPAPLDPSQPASTAA